MKAMTCNIIIGNWEFDYCHKVEIKTSWKTLTDTCTIHLPNVQGTLDTKIKVGDEVIVRLGYDGVLSEDFRGYVARVKPASPMVIECQDEMWKLKQQTVSHSWKSASLEEVLKFLVPHAQVKVPGITLSPFRLDKVTKAQALEKIKEEYGLCVFFRGPELYIGLPYGIDEEPFEFRYHMQKNVASFGSLEYRRKEDVRVKVKAISLLPNNTKHEVEVGDSDGEQHTLHFYNLTKEELKQQAEAKIDLLKFDGYKGSFTAFGQPNAQHSGIAKLKDDTYQDRGGDYFIDAVSIAYGPDGYRRELELGKRATSK